MGQRYLTHESDDARWEAHRVERKLPAWDVAGFKGVGKNDIFKINKKTEASTAQQQQQQHKQHNNQQQQQRSGAR